MNNIGDLVMVGPASVVLLETFDPEIVQKAKFLSLE